MRIVNKKHRSDMPSDEGGPAPLDATSRWSAMLHSKSRRKYAVGAVVGGLAACAIGVAAVSGDLPFFGTSVPTNITTSNLVTTTTSVPVSGGSSGSGSATTTTDGSGSTTPSTQPVVGSIAPASGSFDSVACPTASSCVAVGAASDGTGAIATTGDSGANWAGRSAPAKANGLNSVSCGNQSHCTAVGSNTLISTSDGGTTWASDSVPDKNVNLLGVSCASANDCVATGLSSPSPVLTPVAVILSTQDGGQSWQDAQVPNGVPGIGAVSCPTTSECLGVGPTILRSTDGGQSWTNVAVPGGLTEALRAIACASATACIAVASNPAGATDPSAPALGFATSDGGSTWSPITLPAGTAAIDSVTCPDASSCLVAGAGTSPTAPGFVMTSPSDGSAWVPGQSPGAISDVLAMACVDEQHCVVVGRGSNGPAIASTSTGPSGTWTVDPEVSQ
jgi:photosystem II stability/assembly factor-like uncharacterized protein